MSVQVADDAVEVTYGQTTLLRYVFRPDSAQDDSPRPYAHPVRTLAGEVITSVGPEDHRWHAGISMAVADVSGHNFWGGPTYVEGQGYVHRRDHGEIVHRRWLDTLREELSWIAPGGVELLTEVRDIRVEDVDPRRGSWTLRWAYRLRNVSGSRMLFGSPATNGRAGAGYGGLFWRGATQFRNGEVRTERDRGEDTVNGSQAQVLTFTGETAKLAFVAEHPTTWFVRSAEYPGVCPALAFHNPHPLEPGAELTGHHRIEITALG